MNPRGRVILVIWARRGVELPCAASLLRSPQWAAPLTSTGSPYMDSRIHPPPPPRPACLQPLRFPLLLLRCQDPCWPYIWRWEREKKKEEVCTPWNGREVREASVPAGRWSSRSLFAARLGACVTSSSLVLPACVHVFCSWESNYRLVQWLCPFLKVNLSTVFF